MARKSVAVFCALFLGLAMGFTPGRGIGGAPRVARVRVSSLSAARGGDSDAVDRVRRSLLVGVGALALDPWEPAGAEDANWQGTPSGSKYVIVKEGPKEQVAAQTGNGITFDYEGWLGGFGETKFDSSIDRRAPLATRLGSGQLIKGLDEAIVGMRVGETRRVVVPSDIGYGSVGFPKEGPDAGSVVPPNSDLYFQIRLRSCTVRPF